MLGVGVYLYTRALGVDTGGRGAVMCESHRLVRCGFVYSAVVPCISTGGWGSQMSRVLYTRYSI